MALLALNAMAARAGEWSAVQLPVIAATRSFCITDCGATTAATDNTTAIQAALDATITGTPTAIFRPTAARQPLPHLYNIRGQRLPAASGKIGQAQRRRSIYISNGKKYVKN